MDNQTAIKVLKENVPKTCKMVDGRYKGGFDDWESDMGQAILIAISALENQEKLRSDSWDAGYSYGAKKGYEEGYALGITQPI